MNPRAATLALIAMCGGCMTAQVYDGAKRGSDEGARISGDPRITKGNSNALFRCGAGAGRRGPRALGARGRRPGAWVRLSG